MQTLYLKVEKDKIAPFVIFSGDPFRVEILKNNLDEIEKIGFFREFNTYTGTYKGMRVTISSTGIGSPSAAIAMEEMYQAGMKVAVRMGTSMALNDHMLGKFFIPVASMRREGTSITYAEQGYPAVADFGLLSAMNAAVSRSGREFYNGLTCTMDGFYSQMRESRLSQERRTDISRVFRELKSMHIEGVDMESSCILTLGRLMGVKACVVTLVTVLENLKNTLNSAERAEGERLLCRVTLEGLRNYAA